MKAVFLTRNDIFGKAKDGGTLCCFRNFELLKLIFGDDNVYACVIAPNVGYTEVQSEKIKTFCINRSKMAILSYAFQNRLYFNIKTENTICNYINSLQCDLIFISDTRFGSIISKLNRSMTKVIFAHNLEKNYIKRMANNNILNLILYPAFCYNEKKSMEFADKFICLNYRDESLFEKNYGNKADIILPITLADTYIPSIGDNCMEKTNIKKIVFVGSLFHSNLEGITWFIKNVMPYVNCELTVVGKGFENKRKMLEGKNIKIIGTVDSLEEYYNEADAVVEPILSGDGMKVKTAEAMMYGKNIFATDEALEGYDISGIEGIFRCNDAASFISALNLAYKESNYMKFNTSVRECFIQKYESKRYVNKVKELLLQ